MARILFVQSLFVEQFGVMTLSAIAKTKGHKAALAMGLTKDIVRKAQDFKPDVVGFSVLTGYQKSYLKLSQILKQNLVPKPIILFGGPHTTFFPKIIIEKEVDIVCQGEGEGALTDILDAIDNGNDFEGINNLVLKKGNGFINFPMRFLVDVDKMPFPDREIYRDYPIIYKANSTLFMASRGCPYNCSFCFNKEMSNMVKSLGSWTRFRSVDNLIEEIENVHQSRSIRNIGFADDIFILKHDWLMKFLEAYASKFSIPFSCAVRADLMTLEIARALKKAGCCQVTFGLETGDEKIRSLILKKNISDDQIKKTASILHQVGIPFFTTNMMGLPGEKIEEALKTLKLNIMIGTESAWTSLFQPFPGTELANYCLEKGFIERSISTDSPVDTHTNSLLHQPDIDKVIRLQKFAYIVVKFPSTLPLIEKLITFNFPTFYYYLHRISYLLLYFRKIYRKTWIEIIKYAYIAWRYYK